MHARMNHPVMVLPEAMNVLQSLGNLTKQGLPEKLLELVHLRASQINGCSVCVDMHPKVARKLGEIGRLPPGGHRKQPLIGLAQPAGDLRMHVHADAAAIDLTGAQVDEVACRPR